MILPAIEAALLILLVAAPPSFILQKLAAVLEAATLPLQSAWEQA